MGGSSRGDPRQRRADRPRRLIAQAAIDSERVKLPDRTDAGPPSDYDGYLQMPAEHRSIVGGEPRMRRKLSLFVAIVGALVIAAPVGDITNGAADVGEHPYVGELLFYVPDATDSRFDDPGGWFTCSGTLLNSTIVVTAGHCTFGVGKDGASTTHGGVDTTAAEGGSGAVSYTHLTLPTIYSV